MAISNRHRKKVERHRVVPLEVEPAVPQSLGRAQLGETMEVGLEHDILVAGQSDRRPFVVPKVGQIAARQPLFDLLQKRGRKASVDLGRLGFKQ